MRLEKEILIIGKKGGLLEEGVAAALGRSIFSVAFAKEAVNDIGRECRDIKVFAMFVDTAESTKDVFVYLRDASYDRGVRICIIGEPLELDKAEKLLGRENVSARFDRPVDAKEVAAVLMNLWAEASEQAERKAILLVDDDAVFMRHMQNILKPKYRVYMVNSGASALMLMAKRNIDLVLLDYNMPVIMGPRVLEMFRSEDDFKNVPVMYLTGCAETDVIVEAFQLGAVGYLSKLEPAASILSKLDRFFNQENIR